MVTIEPSGRTLFRVFFPSAARVEVIGTFTGWAERPLLLAHRYPGWWIGAADIPAGDHQFVYRVDGGVEVADFAAHGVTEVHGRRGMVSVLKVPAAATVEVKPGSVPAPSAERKHS